jgi:hypothetical protein
LQIKPQSIFLSSAIILVLSSVFAWSAYAQYEREVPPQENGIGNSFSDEVRRIFDAFSDADLWRVFDTARPIQCSNLVSDTGEWREVAFFNEYREFGDWHRTSLDKVRDDLAVYTFKGLCDGQRSPVQVKTEFPVDHSFKDYEDGKIGFRDIDVIVNAPVTARFDSQGGVYTFDLPYLFRVSDKDANPLYALNPRTVSDRYAPDVTNRWECKLVAVADTRYQFLICRTRLVTRDSKSGNRNAGGLYGTSAFSILSDGGEASSSVKLTFENDVERVTPSTGAHPSEPRLGFRNLHEPSRDK